MVGEATDICLRVLKESNKSRFDSTRVNKTEAMYERPRVKVERGSIFSCTPDLLYISSIVFRQEKFTCVRG